MKAQEFRNIIQKPYVFHLHTRYTDGRLDAVDYFRFAQDNSVKTIIFTEHVRKELKYSFEEFTREVKETQKDFHDIDVIIGAEAKVLPGGDLDICEEVLNNIELIAFACHGFPDDKELYEDSFNKLFSDSRWKSYARVFVHPGRFLKSRGWLNDNHNLLSRLIDKAISEEVFVERNKPEKVPPENLLIPDEWKIIGFDIHTRKGLEDYKNFLNQPKNNGVTSES